MEVTKLRILLDIDINTSLLGFGWILPNKSRCYALFFANYAKAIPYELIDCQINFGCRRLALCRRKLCDGHNLQVYVEIVFHYNVILLGCIMFPY